jgi:hypothetical protein
MYFINLGVIQLTANSVSTVVTNLELPFRCDQIRLENCILDANVIQFRDFELDDVALKMGKTSTILPAEFVENGRDTAVSVPLRIGGAGFEKISFVIDQVDPVNAVKFANLWCRVNVLDAKTKQVAEKIERFSPAG